MNLQNSDTIAAIAGDEAAELLERHARPPREATRADRPVTVAVDSRGDSVHQSGPQQWQRIVIE